MARGLGPEEVNDPAFSGSGADYDDESENDDDDE